MIDWMAMNGINMPLAPMGQEIIWQRVYKKYGVSEEELKDFFVGPAYNAFGRMGCIDGFGGPLPQSWIENENILQKKILKQGTSAWHDTCSAGIYRPYPSCPGKEKSGTEIYKPHMA